MAPTILITGETLVDFLPTDGDDEGLAAVESFARRPGGCPANVAVGLANLGAAPWFWTRVGADPFGDLLVETLADAGVPDRFVERDPDAKTTLAFVAYEGGDPEFSFYREGTADARMEPGRVPDETLDAVEFVFAAGGVMLSADPGRAATMDVLDRADGRATTVFDANARPELYADAETFPRRVRTVLPHVDVVKGGAGDLRRAGFAGADEDELVRTVTGAGPHTVLLTRGADGARFYSTEPAPWGAVDVAHPGYDVDAVDPTGAGDAFTAGALAALADGESPAEVLAFANAVGATATTAAGAMAALPGRGAVRALRDRD
ncbi:MAG: PfkB family carbohydrate kinase [Halobacteriaceae archaeon]